ncbi:MAG: formyltetrahydrofolate deformylase [Gammaproteobacteria bacterium]|nr:formyltetrahydrofolate deformylase [Gammaproteobacteria bacterium]MDH5692763.1 formyltetrahydrofolate deformylase [Gammaproteobacteria bacterium]
MTAHKNIAVLLLTCPDQPGLVSRIADFVFKNGGNILDLDEHADPYEKEFALRLAWDYSDFTIEKEDIASEFAKLAQTLKAQWRIQFREPPLRLAVFVSRYQHCLLELLWRYSLNEFPAEISVIISNHKDSEKIAEQYQIPFYHYPIDAKIKDTQEKKELELLKDHQIDTIVLARYMQILSKRFTEAYPNQIINIHHSFLPAFAGADPYRKAHQRGVKIIGATSHYVTADLDEGPIIEQDITRISHKDSVEDLIRKGRDLERLVFARAIRLHCEHRVLVRGNKTLVFE